MDMNLRDDLYENLSRHNSQILFIQRGHVGIDLTAIRSSLRGYMDIDEKEMEDYDGQALVFMKDYSKFRQKQVVGNFTINNQFVIFWNEFNVFYTELSHAKGNSRVSMQTLKLTVDPEEKRNFITNVVSCSDPFKLCISIRQTGLSECVLVYDLKRGVEIESFDMGNESKVFFDSKGNAYLTENQIMINVQ
jgi:hypothetical protein